MDPKYARVSMIEALRFLRNHSGTVMFMTEKARMLTFKGKRELHLLRKLTLSHWLIGLNVSGMILTD